MTIEEMTTRIASYDAEIQSVQDPLNEQQRRRKVVVAEVVELMARSPHRDPKTLGRRINLELSIKALDRGLLAFKDSSYELGSSRIGELLEADGYAPIGADASRNYRGELPWPGSIRELEAQLRHLTKKRDELAAKLAEASLSDDERAERDAANDRYRTTCNAMRLKHSEDGTYLIARAADGRALELDELDSEQRAALTRANAEYASR